MKINNAFNRIVFGGLAMLGLAATPACIKNRAVTMPSASTGAWHKVTGIRYQTPTRGINRSQAAEGVLRLANQREAFNQWNKCIIISAAIKQQANKNVGRAAHQLEHFSYGRSETLNRLGQALGIAAVAGTAANNLIDSFDNSARTEMAHQCMADMGYVFVSYDQPTQQVTPNQNGGFNVTGP